MHTRSRFNTRCYAIFLGYFRAIKRLVCHRPTKYHRHIGTQAVRQREVIRSPLVLHIEAKLRSCISNVTIINNRVVTHIFTGVICQKIVERIIRICAKDVGNKEVIRRKNLIMRTERNGVIAGIYREVIGHNYRMLAQRVSTGKGICSDADRRILAIAHLRNLYHRQLAIRISAVIDIRITDTQLIKDLLRSTRIEFGDYRVGGRYRRVTRTIEVECRCRIRKLIFCSIQEVVTQRKVVARIDIPIQTSHQRARTTANQAAAISSSIVAGELLVTTRNRNSILLREVTTVIADIVRRRRTLAIILSVYKEEEFILDNSTTYRSAIYLRILCRKLISGRALAIEILIVEICVRRTRKSVCSRLGDGVDTATRKAVLTHIERSNYDLHRFERINRNRVGIRQSAIRAIRRESVYIVTHNSVNLERIVTTTRTRNRHTATLQRLRIRRQARKVVNRTRHRRQHTHLLARERDARPFARIVIRAGNHDHIFNIVLHLIEVRIYGTLTTEVEHHILIQHRFIADKRKLRLVRTSDTHTLQMVCSRVVGNGTILRL